jgi:hypothetical protein
LFWSKAKSINPSRSLPYGTFPFLAISSRPWISCLSPSFISNFNLVILVLFVVGRNLQYPKRQPSKLHIRMAWNFEHWTFAPKTKLCAY